MLIQFTVSNYASIRDEITLSMLADATTDHHNMLIPFRKERILPFAAIYGANAAGKTNIMRAFTAAIMTIRESNNRQITDPLIRMMPFAFDEHKSLEPCRFDLIFTVRDVKYVYGFTADTARVYEEYLYEYRSSKPSMIFERTNVSDYQFVRSKYNKFNAYVQKNTDNKLFLATATAWNCKETEAAYRWLAESIDTYDTEALESQMPAVLADDPDSDLQRYVTSMLHAADINVSGYTVRQSDLGPEDIAGMPLGLIRQMAGERMTQMKKYEITTEHDIACADGIKKYTLPFQLESNGTRRFVYISPIIKNAIDKGRTIFIDEIDASLHPFLVDYILRIFADKDQNPNGAQLIVTTQEVSLLDLDRFRRDQIYFAEKDNRTGATDLYSLDEFAPRKNADIRKGYLQGRYGAIPVIGGEGIAW